MCTPGTLSWGRSCPPVYNLRTPSFPSLSDTGGIQASRLGPAGLGRRGVELWCLRWCQPSQHGGVAVPACGGAQACQGAGALCRVEGVRGGIVGAQMLNFMYF